MRQHVNLNYYEEMYVFKGEAHLISLIMELVYPPSMNTHILSMSVAVSRFLTDIIPDDFGVM